MILTVGPLKLTLGNKAVSNIRTKANIGQVLSRSGASFLGEGAEWAPASYGNYMAQSVPAYRAIKLRADAVASAPLKVYRRNASGEPAWVGSEHPIQQILDSVNPFWTHSDLLRATETNLSVWGSAFWFLDSTSFKGVTLWPLRSDRMRIVADRREVANQYIAGFVYQTDRGTRIPLTVEEVVWFRYFNPLDEFGGLSPIAAGRMSLDMGKEALRYNRTFFRNSGMPEMIISVQGPINDEELAAFYKRWETRFTGSDNAHRPLIWDGSQGPEPKTLGLSQKDMEFLATLDYTVEDAARIWGVPPPKLYSQKASIYNNVRQADVEFYTDTVIGEWKFIETEITEMLLPNLTRMMGVPAEPGLYVAFDTSNVPALQEALAEQATRDREDVKTGILTINEARARRHMPPVPWGDDFLAPVTLAPLGQGAPPVSPRNAQRGLRLDATVQDRIAEMAPRRMARGEAKFATMQRHLFGLQRSDVLARLTKQPATASAGRNSHEKALQDQLFDPLQWAGVFAGKGKAVLSAILTLAGQEAVQEFALGAFDPERQSVREWVDQRVAMWSDRVNMETARLLTGEILLGIAAEEGIPALSARVEKVFRFNDEVRAERIARTETLGAMSRGHLEAYDQSGVVEKKMWISALDERTRETHLEAHGQTVGLYESFLVGGEFLEAPGIGGSPENVINCRCTVAPVLEG